ncbi:hypothetical protein HDU96_004110 [Phlyctochytrium bullatum]|nr:hypothetical protein HDU96_004110 [Phlyctochytrium bullatum]
MTTIVATTTVRTVKTITTHQSNRVPPPTHRFEEDGELTPDGDISFHPEIGVTQHTTVARNGELVKDETLQGVAADEASSRRDSGGCLDGGVVYQDQDDDDDEEDLFDDDVVDKEGVRLKPALKVEEAKTRVTSSGSIVEMARVPSSVSTVGDVVRFHCVDEFWRFEEAGYG